MKINTTVIRSGYDGKKCLVHARFCEAPGFLIATAQHLDVTGCDMFDGIYSSKSYDGGKAWTEFAPEPELAAIHNKEYTVVGCDGTPMYHKKTGKVIITGHMGQYDKNGKRPAVRVRSTWYSVYDEEKGKDTPIRWLQSLQESEFAMPVMDPLLVAEDYNPEVEDDYLIPLGAMKAEDVLVLVTVTVPKELEKMSVNLQAPIVINADSKKAAQIIVNPEQYPVKYYIYDILQDRKKEGE